MGTLSLDSRFTDPVVREFVSRFGDQCAYRRFSRLRGLLVVAVTLLIALFIILPNLMGASGVIAPPCPTPGAGSIQPNYGWPPPAIRIALVIGFGIAMVFGEWLHRTCALALLVFYQFWWGDIKQTLVIIVLAISAMYVFVVAFRLISAFLGQIFTGEIRITPGEILSLDDKDLPVYTVLIPMYKEPEVAAVIVRAMKNLDYPAYKLDIKILVEEDDRVTRDALDTVSLPDQFDVVVVPHDPSSPKCKPRACDHGLTQAKGKYLVIYDAEDRPEPDQLKKAIVAFQKAKDNVVCLQAKLNFFNPNQNLLTGLFTIEYTTWFDIFLPGLHAMRVPIPLGGTSNHFKVDALNRIGGWDPFNVTEDCDLGLRLWRNGYRTKILDSTTWEEANSQLGNWVRQRSRWIKGYFQTHLVHTRDLLRLIFGVSPRTFIAKHTAKSHVIPNEKKPAKERGLGIYGTATSMMTVGGLTFILMLNPLFWAIGGAYLERRTIATLFEPDAILGGFEHSETIHTFLNETWQLVYFDSKTIPDMKISIYNAQTTPDDVKDLNDWAYFSQIFYPFVVGLVLANGVFILLSIWACIKRRRWELLPITLVIPLYWALISFAAWKGVLQLLTRPFYWEKTTHGLSGDAHMNENAWMPTARK